MKHPSSFFFYPPKGKRIGGQGQVVQGWSGRLCLCLANQSPGPEGERSACSLPAPTCARCLLLKKPPSGVGASGASPVLQKLRADTLLGSKVEKEFKEGPSGLGVRLELILFYF